MKSYGEFYKGENTSRAEQSGFTATSNLDIHSEIGYASPQLALVSESTTPNEACISVIVPDGTTYFFSKTTGKIWKRTTDGTYSLVAANINTAHRGARYFNGKLYYWTASKLGYKQITGSITVSIADPCVVTLASHGLATADPVSFLTTGALPTGITAGTTYYARPDTSLTEVDEFWLYDTAAHATSGGATGRVASSGTQLGTHTMWVHTFATLANGNARGSAILNLSLFIADGNDISSVDNTGTFAQSSLDLEVNYIITDIAAVGNDLLIGTVNSTSNGFCKAFLWDTYSSSWSYEDEVFEAGINCFIQTDNLTLAQCGNAGWIYYWTGSRLEKFKKIKGITTTNTATYHALTTTLNGKALLANGTYIYSIHRENKDLPMAICREYTSTGTINSILAVGSQLLVSYTNGETIGVDKIGTNYATAYLDTPEANEESQMVEVYYDSLPTGTSIGISTKINGGDWTVQTPITDTINKRVYFDGGLLDVVFMQARATLTPSTTSKPVIRNIVIK